MNADSEQQLSLSAFINADQEQQLSRRSSAFIGGR
jgi:hypothetical protein